MIVALGAARGLIEAGLSDLADAAARYGIRVAPPVAGDRFWVTRCARVGGGDAERPVSVEAIDAPIGILGWVAGWGACAAGGSARCRTWGIIASVDADAATPPGSMFGSKRVLMTYQAVVEVARPANAAAWR